MERKLTKNLINWKNNIDKLPLFLVGTRNVGKTYLLKYFLDNFCDNYIYIDFETSKKTNEVFSSISSLDDFITKLSIHANKTIEKDKTVIVLDEVQACKEVLETIKYFAKKCDYYIIYAGSTLSSIISSDELKIPFDNIRIECLYPMDFEEFLIAINERILAEQITSAYKDFTPLDETSHKLAHKLFLHYLCIGGMPTCILNYLDTNKNVLLFNRKEQINIINSYIADIVEYTKGVDAIKCNELYKSLPLQFDKKNFKFQYKFLSEDANNRKYDRPLNFLVSSCIVLKSNLINKPKFPLNEHQKNNSFKLYPNDIGLFVALSKIPVENILLNNDNDNTLKVITEIYIAEALTSNNHELFYWESSSEAELSFLLNFTERIIPVDLKYSNKMSKSLTSYKHKHKPLYSIRISSNNFEHKNGIKNVPFYAVHLLK